MASLNTLRAFLSEVGTGSREELRQIKNWSLHRFRETVKDSSREDHSGGAIVTSPWPLRCKASATKPVALIYSMKWR
jgi:hypothetical protein